MSALKLGVACVVMCIALLTIGLWPFNFQPKNDVHWLEGRNGLRFQGGNSSFDRAGGVVLTQGPLILPEGSDQGISIEIWLQPEEEPQRGIHYILSFYDGQKEAAFFVGQWKSYLIVGKNLVGPDQERHYKKIHIKSALQRNEAAFLTITSDEKGTAIYLNGQKQKGSSSFFLLGQRKSLSKFSVLLGNSSSAKGAWSGDVFGLAFYRRALTGKEVTQDFDWWTGQSTPHSSKKRDALALYRFEERSGRIAQSAFYTTNSLLIPAFLPFKKKVLSPLDFPRHDVEDMIVNVLGFMPFGFLLILWLRETQPDRPCVIFFCALSIGVLVSLVIELVQVYLPTRDSSQMDLLCNAVGTFVGGIVGRKRMGSETG